MLLTGWVHFLVDGEPLAMSKRPQGHSSPSTTCWPSLGVDAARWYFASRGANLDMNVDIEEARRRQALETGDYDEARKSPVFYVQYAHARVASILRTGEAGLTPAPSVAGLLADRDEGTLARCRSLPGGRRGRGCRQGDAGRHDVCHRARDGIPRVLPRRAGHRPRGTRALHPAVGARRCDANLARKRARPAGDLRARLDVAPAWRPPARPRPASDLSPRAPAGCPARRHASR